jgi:hypothetical protein
MGAVSETSDVYRLIYCGVSAIPDTVRIGTRDATNILETDLSTRGGSRASSVGDPGDFVPANSRHKLPAPQQ